MGESLGLSILREIQRPIVDTVLSQGLLDRASHWYQRFYDTRKVLILPLEPVRAYILFSSILQFLTGVRMVSRHEFC
jgi:hypothetical protein